MTFQDEQKQAEYNAFVTYYRLVAQRPHTSAKMSRLNQLDSIMRGDFPGALNELKNEQRKQQVERTAERKLGKPEGSALTRRGSLPVAKQPQPGTGRYERLKAAGLLPSQQAAAQSGKLEAVKVVAGGDLERGDLVVIEKGKAKKVKGIDMSKAVLVHGVDNIADLISESAIAEEKALSEAGIEEYAKGLDREDLLAACKNSTAKEIVEKFGKQMIYDFLLDWGENPDALSEKTDRQLANTLKKHIAG